MRRRAWLLTLVALGAAKALATGSADTTGAAAGNGPPPPPFDRRALARVLDPPLGLPDLPLPPDNPPTAASIHLGRKLFLDRRLSVNGTLSCAMCHVPEQGFAVNELQTAVGLEGRRLRRNAPTLLNVAYAGPFFHDGREPDLDLQPLDVLVNPDEMAAPSLGAVAAKVRSLPDYRGTFEDAYQGPATVERVGQAIATYLRTLLAAASPFDRWRFGGEAEAVSHEAGRGHALFVGKAGCGACHTIAADHALFTDHGFHDTGIGWNRSLGPRAGGDPVRVALAPGLEALLEPSVVASVGEPAANDLGRYEVTGVPVDRWRFKTPTLRNVALTAPYMHDGSIATLEGVIRLYDRGSFPHEGLDPLLRPLGLSEAEVAELVAFLESLTSGDVEELVDDARSEEVGNPTATE